jgi:hypothetical protein
MTTDETRKRHQRVMQASMMLAFLPLFWFAGVINVWNVLGFISVAVYGIKQLWSVYRETRELTGK